MRPRTFILLILVLVVAAVAVIAFFLLRSGDNLLADLLPGNNQQQVEESDAQEPGLPPPTATPDTNYVPVVVARVKLPVGELITEELIKVERRPDDNVAVLAQVTFDQADQVIGQIVKTEIPAGQEILRPMLALNPTDLASLGSDLSLYVDQGRVAVAFPISHLSGAAYAMRPGDLVDVFMSLTLVEVDEDFQTALLNLEERVFEPDLLEGRAFLFPKALQGRLEVIPGLNIVGLIGPSREQTQIPRKVTQLTLQQVQVLWVGNWLDPVNGYAPEFSSEAVLSATPVPAAAGGDGQAVPLPTPTKQRPEDRPDVVILSMSAQDALALKYALETGIDVALVLRSQGDSSVFITTSVSLPQIVQQGLLAIPQQNTFSLEPRIELVPTPGLPDVPLTDQ
jgi:Flp pilus assembly protein CpaB